MPTIQYREHDGTSHTIDAPVGLSLMEAAVNEGIPGIDADCGGECACATCHIYLDATWDGLVDPATDAEIEMLGFAVDVLPESRLSCRIPVRADYDGLIVRLPASQH